MAAVKLAGFLVLLGVIFCCAHLVGGRAGPVTTGHSQIQYTGDDSTANGTNNRTGGTNGGGMDMGGNP